MGFRNLGLFGKKGLSFAKIKLSKSKIDSDKSTTITINIKNKEEKFEKIVVATKTDDEKSQYLKIDRSSILLPSLEFPNRNTGDHVITITPYNIPLSKMPFKITVEVFANDNKQPILKKEFSLTVNKK
jgi:hypothetical protein